MHIILHVYVAFLIAFLRFYDVFHIAKGLMENANSGANFSHNYFIKFFPFSAQLGRL